MEKLKIGIFGVGRGMGVAKALMMNNCEIVAICDFHQERRERAAKELGKGVAVYDNFDAFIEHKMDAVVLANYFHEHAPYAIRCLQKGIHVYSECISNGTMAEGVELIRAAEKCDAIYFMGENCPQMVFNQEIKRVCDSKTLGKVLFAECEYNHSSDPADYQWTKEINYFPEHWRNYLPRSYYITHSLGPVMYATGATPKRVTSFAIFSPMPDNAATATQIGDAASIITTQNDDGSVFRVTGCARFGASEYSCRVCGTKGQVENLRGMGDKIMLRYNSWEKPEGQEAEQLYDARLDEKDEEIIKKMKGHGGADYLTARLFVECISEHKQPGIPFDIYSAINMSSVAILAHRSMLEGGKPYDIPDFHLEECRKQYENDRLSPFYVSKEVPPTLPCCSHPDYHPSEQQLKLYMEAIK